MSETNRDTNGKFLPGHGLGGPGRPPREREREVLAAISEALPPAMIKAKLLAALELAETQKSPRAMIACLEFAAGYTIGKPIARSISASTKFEDMLARLGSNEPMTIGEE